MHTEFTSGGMFLFLSFLPLIIYFILISLFVYLVIKVIRFMNEKIKLDRVRNEQLSELTKALNQDKRVK